MHIDKIKTIEINNVGEDEKCINYTLGAFFTPSNDSIYSISILNE
jgi:hypothetical protein